MNNSIFKSRNRIPLLIILAPISVFSINAHAINCKIATSFSEKTICSTALLANLDKALNQNYKSMFYSNIGAGARNDLRKTQKEWILKVNRCKTDDCILELYKSRLGEMCEYPVSTGIHGYCNSYEYVFEHSLEFIGPPSSMMF